MELEFSNGLLEAWYATWAVLAGSAIAIVLAVLVFARPGRDVPKLLLKTVMVIAAAASLPLTLARLGINMALSEPADPLGYLSVVASIGAIVVGVPVLFRWTIPRWVPDRLWRRSDTMADEVPTPPEGITLGGETEAQGPPTATFAGSPEGDQGATQAGSPEGDPGATVVRPAQGDQGATQMGTRQGGQGATMAGSGAAAPQQPSAFLLFRSGPNAGQSIPLAGAQTLIGRSPESDVVVDDPTVSRRHARLSYQEGQYTLEDAGSSVGTLVEGSLTNVRQPLTSGTTIRLGDTELVFVQSGVSGQTMASGGTPGTPVPAGAPGETMVIGEPSEPVMAWLAVRSGPNKGNTYQLRAADLHIGRGQDNDVMLEDAGVSRHHAMLRYQDGAFILLDVGSSGGTRVNDEPAEGSVLRVGGTLQAGQTRMTLVPVEGQQSTAPATSSGETIVAQPGGGAAGVVLVVQSGPDSGTSFPLREGENLLGREPTAEVTLRDNAVSRRHAVLRRQGNDVVVHDLGSRSGTLVDGQRVTGRQLVSGDGIALGSSELVFMQVQS